jgi:hypothetical protein
MERYGCLDGPFEKSKPDQGNEQTQRFYSTAGRAARKNEFGLAQAFSDKMGFLRKNALWVAVSITYFSTVPEKGRRLKEKF